MRVEHTVPRSGVGRWVSVLEDGHAVPRSRGAGGNNGRVEGKDVKLDDDDDNHGTYK